MSWQVPSFGSVRRAAAALACLVVISGCGGGGSDEPPPVALLDISLLRTGPLEVEIAWSDDPLAASFTVFRDGVVLADVDAVALVDASVFPDETYCYQVSGYDESGFLVSASDTACVTLVF